MSTEKIKKISIKQIKAARMLLGWSQADLGKAADSAMLRFRA